MVVMLLVVFFFSNGGASTYINVVFHEASLDVRLDLSQVMMYHEWVILNVGYWTAPISGLHDAARSLRSQILPLMPWLLSFLDYS